MKCLWIVLTFTLGCSIVMAGNAPAKTKETNSRISAYEGKFFTGTQDPDYRDYDLALRNRLIRRIQQKFGVELRPGTYSGFDLLEIESLLRVKKPNEPFDLFLRMFPKSP